nr:MAG TPA: hypothetical protein [Caudoviricetes sp.]
MSHQLLIVAFCLSGTKIRKKLDKTVRLRT